MMRRLGAWSGAVAALLAVSTAAADEEVVSAQDRARAQELFDSALADAQAGNFASACPKFAASHAADPKTTALLNLARCYEKVRHYASAWATFHEAIALARRVGREDLAARAREEAEALAPSLVRLTVRVPPASRVPGLKVTRDGASVPRAEWDVAIPVDDGEHTVTAQADGRVPWSARVVVRGANQAVDVPLLARAPVEPTARRAAADHAAPPASARPSWWTPLRTTGVALVGAGAAAGVAGVVLGLIAKSDYDDARAACTADDACPAGAVARSEDARSLATTGTVVGLAGLVVGAVGAGLVLFAPSPRAGAERGSAALRVVAGSNTIGVVGAW